MTETNELAVATASRLRRMGATRVLVIVNPGSRKGKRALPPTLAALRDAGFIPDVAVTEAPRHATTLVRQHVSAEPGKYAAVLSVGGDGTAMEVATALSELPDAPPLGIVAAGTASVLARSLGVPVNSARAVVALLNAELVPMDLGRIEGGPAFVSGLGVGLDATMIGRASSILKCIYSPSSHVEAARIFWRMLRGGVSRDCHVRIIRGRRVRIETDLPRPMQADGELLGLTPVDIRVEPNAVRVLVPHATPRRWRMPRLASTRGHPEQLESCTP